MNIPYIDAATMARTLDYGGLVAHLRQAHCQSPPDVQRVLMQQRSPQGSDNGFLIWPAWQPGAHLGVKICTLFPDNRERPTVQALYVLLSDRDGSVQALLDGTEETYWKTAADSALGADLLARPDAQHLLLVGAGALAPHLVRAYCAVRPGLRQVTVWNRTPDKAEAVVRQLAPALPGVCLAASQDLAASAARADIVCTATASARPVLQGAWLRPGTHVDLIGGFTPQMREADDDTVRHARIFVDSRWFTLDHAGDLTQPIASGVIRREDVLGDLFDLCSGRVAGRQSASDMTVFKSGGGAHLDLMTAQYIVQSVARAAA